MANTVKKFEYTVMCCKRSKDFADERERDLYRKIFDNAFFRVWCGEKFPDCEDTHSARRAYSRRWEAEFYSRPEERMKLREKWKRTWKRRYKKDAKFTRKKQELGRKSALRQWWGSAKTRMIKTLQGMCTVPKVRFDK
jgi:hypothetical protein